MLLFSNFELKVRFTLLDITSYKFCIKWNIFTTTLHFRYYVL